MTPKPTDEKKAAARNIAENMIVAKLHEDGVIAVDEDAKSVVIDMRKSVLEKYGASSSYDLGRILNKLEAGLKLTGYTVTTKRLEIV
jgi:nicotinamide mononucleotide (NMN) deamidase PncC